MKKTILLFLLLPAVSFAQISVLESEVSKSKSKDFKIKDKKIGSYKIDFPLPKNWVLEEFDGAVRLLRGVTNDIFINLSISMVKMDFDNIKSDRLRECKLEPGAYWTKVDEGYRITGFPLNSNAFKSGLLVGDILKQINSIDIKDVDSWCQTLKKEEEMIVVFDRNDEIEAISLLPNSLIKGEGIMSNQYDNYYVLFSDEFEELGVNYGRLILRTFFKVSSGTALQIDSIIFIKNYNRNQGINPSEFFSEYGQLFKSINQMISFK